MKAYKEGGGTASLILSLWMVNVMLQVLYAGKEPWYPLNKMLGGLQSGPDWEEKKLLLLPGSNPELSSLLHSR